MQCQSSFDTLDMSINRLGILVEKIDDRMDTFGERLAAQEAHIKATKNEVTSVRASVDRLGDAMRREVQDHASLCVGREYAMRKLKKASHAPPPNNPEAQKESTGAFLLDEEFRRMAVQAIGEQRKGFAIPRWVIYLGVIVGVAIVAAIYGAIKLFTS